MDRTLIERAQRGDQEAYAQVAAGASDRLYAVALRVLRDADAASDALQSALVQIWRDLPTLREAERFEAWSYRIVLNCCRSDRRRARRVSPTVSLIEPDVQIPDSQASLAERDSLEGAFRLLNADHRAVLVLAYYRDLSIHEMAEALDISPGTVKSRLHYAREAMRAAIEAEARVEPEGWTA